MGCSGSKVPPQDKPAAGTAASSPKTPPTATTAAPPTAKLPPTGNLSSHPKPHGHVNANNSTNELDISSSNYDRSKGRARKLGAAAVKRQREALERGEDDDEVEAGRQGDAVRKNSEDTLSTIPDRDSVINTA